MLDASLSLPCMSPQLHGSTFLILVLKQPERHPISLRMPTMEMRTPRRVRMSQPRGMHHSLCHASPHGQKGVYFCIWILTRPSSLVRMISCIYAGTRVRTCTHTHTHTCLRTHRYTHAYRHMYIHTHIRAYDIHINAQTNAALAAPCLVSCNLQSFGTDGRI
jgi:hypothetical protein